MCTSLFVAARSTSIIPTLLLRLFDFFQFAVALLVLGWSGKTDGTERSQTRLGAWILQLGTAHCLLQDMKVCSNLWRQVPDCLKWFS